MNVAGRPVLMSFHETLGISCFDISCLIKHMRVCVCVCVMGMKMWLP